MTKAQMVDIVYLAVNGGTYSPDNKVQHPEIELYLGAAIADALINDIRLEEDRSLRRSRKDQDLMKGLLQKQYVCSYKLTPVFDEDRQFYFVTFPGGLQKLPNNSGYDEAMFLNGDNIVKIGSPVDVQGMVSNQTFTWHECYMNEDRAYFINMGYPVCDVIIRAVLDFSSLPNDATVPVPKHLQKTIIDSAIPFFRGQKGIQSDEFNNQNDDSDAI